MSHVKSGGASRINKNSPGQRLGIKRSGGQKIAVGQIIVRQVGLSKRAGKGTKLARNFTIHAEREGVVTFKTRKVRRFTGHTVRRTEVTVE